MSDVAASRTLRIAAHISASEWGGAERRSLALLSGLAARGHDVHVFCNTERIATKTREHGLRAEIVPLGGDVMLGHALAFGRVLRRLKPDVLILITFRRMWLGALAARIGRVPRTIVRVGTSTDVARSAKYRFVLKRWIDDVVVNAHAMREPFLDSLPPDANVRVSVVPNGIMRRPPTMSGDDVRRTLDIPAGAFVAGTVTRLVHGKGLEQMLEAFARVADAYAVITGDGALRESLVTQAERLGIADRVRFTGAREDIGNVLAALDVYLVTSDREGMSNAMLEALAAGLPVVSTPVSGAAEALLEGPVCGVVVPQEPAAIADALEKLRNDLLRRAKFAVAATEVAFSRYTLDAMIDGWEAILLRS